MLVLFARADVGSRRHLFASHPAAYGRVLDVALLPGHRPFILDFPMPNLGKSLSLDLCVETRDRSNTFTCCDISCQSPLPRGSVVRPGETIARF